MNQSNIRFLLEAVSQTTIIFATVFGIWKTWNETESLRMRKRLDSLELFSRKEKKDAPNNS
jgi:hypothetical protein